MTDLNKYINTIRKYTSANQSSFVLVLYLHVRPIAISYQQYDVLWYKVLNILESNNYETHRHHYTANKI